MTAVSSHGTDSLDVKFFNSLLGSQRLPFSSKEFVLVSQSLLFEYLS